MIPKKRTPTHPGEMLLKEFLEPMGISQEVLCQRLGWRRTQLDEILHGRCGITAESAFALAEAFKMEPKFWLNLQREWDLRHRRKRHHKIRPFVLQEKYASCTN